jgi:hypothetical protein
LREGVEVELWNLRVVEWRGEGELKEEGVLRWIKEAARVEFMVGLERGWWFFFFFVGFEGSRLESRRRGEGFLSL